MARVAFVNCFVAATEKRGTGESSTGFPSEDVVGAAPAEASQRRICSIAITSWWIGVVGRPRLGYVSKSASRPSGETGCMK